MAYLLAIVIVALLADRWLMQRQHNKHRMEWEQAFRLERTALLQRLQAPELAVYEQAKRETKQVPVVTYDDDASFHEAKRAMNGNAE